MKHMKPFFYARQHQAVQCLLLGLSEAQYKSICQSVLVIKSSNPTPTVTTSSTVSEASILVALDIGIKFCCIVKRGKDTKIVVVKIAELYFMSHLLAVEYKCKWIKITGKVYSLSCSVFNILLINWRQYVIYKRK